MGTIIVVIAATTILERIAEATNDKDMAELLRGFGIAASSYVFIRLVYVLYKNISNLI
jgi:hypothetical protein